MRQRSQRERIFVQVLRFPNQVEDEVAAADVVCEIGEQLRSEWVVTHVLSDAAAIRISMRFHELLRRCIRKTLEEQSFDRCVPRRVDNRFVGEYRVRKQTRS